MGEVEMKIDPARASALVSQLQSVTERIAAVAKGRPASSPCCVSEILPVYILTRATNRYDWLQSPS